MLNLQTKIKKSLAIVSILCFVNNCDSKKASLPNSAAAASAAAAAQQATSTTDYVNQFLSLVSQITTRRPTLNQEKARRSRLMLALLANIGSGCMGATKVTTLELIVDGIKLSDLDVTILKQTDQYLPTAGTQDLYQFYVGDLSGNGYTFTNDQDQNNLFAPSVHWIVNIPAAQALTVSSIEQITISKELPAYSVDDFCTGTGTATISGCSQQKDIKEILRYQLNNLTIKANGQILYTTNNIDHAFSANTGTETEKSVGLNWQDTEVQFNSSYLNLLQQTNCPSGS